MSGRSLADLPYVLRRSARARQLRLLVKPSGIELVVPVDTPEKAALLFLMQHRDWAERKLVEIRERLAQKSPAVRPLLANGCRVPFQGEETLLQVQSSGSRTLISRRQDGTFDIRVRAGSPEEEDHQVRAALFAWVKHWLKAEAGRVAQAYAPTSGLQPRTIRIKQMKTRWGSCGPHHDINLNWLLAFAPPPVLEYVIVHELCHIRHRNHSADFWALVGRYLPEWRARQNWLKSHGAELFRRLG